MRKLRHGEVSKWTRGHTPGKGRLLNPSHPESRVSASLHCKALSELSLLADHSSSSATVFCSRQALTSTTPLTPLPVVINALRNVKATFSPHLADLSEISENLLSPPSSNAFFTWRPVTTVSLDFPPTSPDSYFSASTHLDSHLSDLLTWEGADFHPQASPLQSHPKTLNIICITTTPKFTALPSSPKLYNQLLNQTLHLNIQETFQTQNLHSRTDSYSWTYSPCNLL